MDLKTQSIKATRIGLGVESNRKLVGLMFFTEHSDRFHTSLRCRSNKFDAAKMVRLPVFIEDGTHYTERDSKLQAVTECTMCIDSSGDESWREFAACVDTDAAFSERRGERDKFIEDYCNTRCSVQLECLEYGEAGGQENILAVWGGVYFTTHSTERKKRIDEQRDKIKAGVFG